MAKFYIAVVQSILLYGAYLWTINNRNWKPSESFHTSAVRHMTGQHIQKHWEGSWTYPNHEDLERKCGLFSIRTYIQRRRGTLRKYMESYREDLLQEAMAITKPSRYKNKILWWKQEYITKEDMTVLTNFWFK